jgi:excisionase family DNA binding protein
MRISKQIIAFEDRRALRVKDFCELYGVGRSTVYTLMRDGKLPDIKIGGRRVIPRAAAELLLQTGERR